MPQYSCNNNFLTNAIILELLSARLVHPGTQKLTILSLFNPIHHRLLWHHFYDIISITSYDHLLQIM